MSRLKLLLMSLFAVVALAAVSANAASAANFEVEENDAFTPAETIAPTVSVTQNFVLKNNIATVECSTLTATGGKLEPAKGSATSLEFGGCSLVGNTKCEVKAGQVKTKPVVATPEAANKVKFAPKTPPEFVKIEIVKKGTESCGLTAGLKVTGTATGEATTGGTEEAAQAIKFNVTAASEELKSAGEAAEFTGVGKISLSSGKKWGMD
jgi:hypothetical protein